METIKLKFLLGITKAVKLKEINERKEYNEDRVFIKEFNDIYNYATFKYYY